MAKNHKKRNRRKQRYIKRERIREVRAENYFKRQANVINALKPVAAVAKRFNDRAAQAERDSRNTEEIKQERNYLQ